MRMIKDLAEKTLLQKACGLTDTVLASLLKQIRAGFSEKEVRTLLERIVLDTKGCESMSFDPIIAFGSSTSQPHHSPGDRQLQVGDLIQFDLGVRVNGYGADLSRVAVMGTPSVEISRVYDAVRFALEKAKQMVEPGIDGRAVDKEIKAWISEQGIAPYQHGLGHGVGLDFNVHEKPVLGERYPQEQMLENDMVFTLEPAVYLPGEFGIRLEDVVCLNNGEVEVWSKAPLELIVL
jgi:Xaa-Pro aminopeptidase